MTTRVIERGLSWTACRYHYFSGKYVIERPQRHPVREVHGWRAWRANTVEHGPLLPPTFLGDWPRWDLAVQACETDAIRERTS